MSAPLSLSTSWLSHRHNDGYDMLKEAAELGFEWVELGHGIRYSLWPGILKAVKEKVVRFSSLHNFCPLPVGFLKAAPNCYEFSDPRSHMRKRAEQLSIETIDHAASFGAKAVVLHLGSTGQFAATDKLEVMLAKGEWKSRRYIQTKLKAVTDHERIFKERGLWVKEILHRLEEHARKQGVRIGLECRESVHEIPLENQWDWIFEGLGPAAGYWHDFGHAARKEALGFLDHLPYFERMSSRLAGCHVHDFVPPDRDHGPLGKGTVPFASFWPMIKTNPVYILELSPRVKREDVMESLSWWKKNGPA